MLLRLSLLSILTFGLLGLVPACGAASGSPGAGGPADGAPQVDAGGSADARAVDCGGSSPRFSDIQGAALSHCSACHGQGPFSGGLDLSAADAYGQLVGVPSTIAPELSRVDPGHPETSLLWLKLTDELTSDQGSPMPMGVDRWVELSADELDPVYCWIEAGAAND